MTFVIFVGRSNDSSIQNIGTIAGSIFAIRSKSSIFSICNANCMRFLTVIGDPDCWKEKIM